MALVRQSHTVLDLETLRYDRLRIEGPCQSYADAHNTVRQVSVTGFDWVYRSTVQHTMSGHVLEIVVGLNSDCRVPACSRTAFDSFELG